MRGYDTVEYAASRLVETIIMYQGDPIMVRRVGYIGSPENITIEGTSLINSTEYQVKLEDCDINPVSLGYVNFNKTATYISRAPMRRDWRQGLRMLNIMDVEGRNPRLIPYRVIANTIMGRYPSFKNSLDSLNSNKAERVAYCRDFSITNEGVLTYKGLIDVGIVSMDNGNVLINDNTSWVREAFDESLEAA